MVQDGQDQEVVVGHGHRDLVDVGVRVHVHVGGLGQLGHGRGGVGLDEGDQADRAGQGVVLVVAEHDDDGFGLHLGRGTDRCDGLCCRVGGGQQQVVQAHQPAAVAS